MSESTADKPPVWLVPVFSFVLGCVITAAVLMPGVSTPDYQRGHADGYKACHGDMSHKLQSRAAEGRQIGIKTGYAAALRGQPLAELIE